MKKKRLVVGILAHVDAGKTTLAESILYTTGNIRKLGRVDHGDAFLDTYELEKARGITIFSKQAEIGSNYVRAQEAIAKAQTNQLGATNLIAREGDLDFTKAITDMKMLEYVKQATLSTAGRLYESSLLNYMR